MKKPDADAVRKLAQVIAGDAQVDWSSLGLDPSALDGRLENLRRLSRVASSFDRHHRSGGSVGSSGPAGAPGSGEPIVRESDISRGDRWPETETSGKGLTRWGALEIVGFLGEGAFGSVYLAFDPMLEREVALKLWKRGEDSAESPLERGRQIRRLLEEARRMARIRHPNVVVVHGADVHQGRVGIWSERLSGETLAVRLQREGPRPPIEVAVHGAQIADALTAVHEAGLVHGDVKEANVVIEESGRVVLFDFGSGRKIADPTSIEPFASTPFYLPPEVLLDGEELSPLTDIYALGVLLHRLLTGLYPREAETLDELRDLHRADRSRSAPPELGPGLDPFAGTTKLELQELIGLATSGDPAKRPGSAREMARSLHFLAERASGREVPTSLPEPTTPLFGREREIASVKERLRAARLLTLTGVGGTGKSRLALAAVHSLAADFPDGTFWIPLVGLGSEPEIVSAALGAMGMTDRTDGGLRDLVRRLAARRLLLVFDNAEHVVESVRALVEEVVTRTEGVRVLVTSRRALGGASEELFRVLPLPVPLEPEGTDREALATATEGVAASVALFADRARRRDPEFDLGSSLPAVERICRRLEGIPLAIEIAAARAASLSPEEILAQLARPLDVGDDLSARPQHRSLRTSMVWSHGLLPPEAQEAFRRISVFAGGWTLAAAVEVVGRPDFSVRESLAILYEHSLLERRRDRTGKIRFSVLETVREFAEELLDAAAETEETSTRHHAHYRDRFLTDGEALFTHGYAAALSGLERESANLERALGWSLARAGAGLSASGTSQGRESLGPTALSRQHSSRRRPDGARGNGDGVRFGEEHAALVLGAVGFWHLSGRDSVAVRRLSETLDLFSGSLTGATLGRLHLARGRFFYLRGFTAAETDLVRAKELLEGLDPIEWARAEAAHGAALTGQARFEEAEIRLAKVVAEFEADADSRTFCMGLRYLADLRYKQGRMEEAAAIVDRAERIARDLGDPSALAMLLVVRGSLAWAKGDLVRALELHEECLEVTAGAPFLPTRSLCHSNLGSVRWAMNEPGPARRHWELAEQLARRWGEDVRRATNLINLVEYFPLEERTRILHEVLETFVRFEHHRYSVLALSELGAHYLDLGRSDVGTRLLASAEELRVRRGIIYPEPTHQNLLANVERARGALSSGEFDALWESGRGITPEQARTLIQTDFAQLPTGDFRTGGTAGAS